MPTTSGRRLTSLFSRSKVEEFCELIVPRDL
jgi:hypothetical protein